jgi:hypothetical protein
MPNYSYELFNSLKNYELFVFLFIFRCSFMGPNFLGNQLSVISKKKRQRPSINKVTIARPRTSQQSDAGLLTRLGIDYFLHPKYLHLLTSMLQV